MAGGAAGWPPYTSALALYAWARDNWNLLDGHLILSTGRSVDSLNDRELVNVAYAYLTTGRDESSVAKLDQSLAPSAEKRMESVEEQNARAHQMLMGRGMIGKPQTLRQKKRAAEEAEEK